MASIGEDIRAHLIASTALGAVLTTYKQAHVIEQNNIPTNPPAKRVWFGRSSETYDKDMSGEDGILMSEWDMEVFAPNDTDVTAITDVIKARLNGHYGTMGARKVKAVFVDDHDDDYLPRGIAESTAAVNMAAIRLTIFTS